MELEAQQSDVGGKKPPSTTTQWESTFGTGDANMGAIGAPLFELNSVKISGQLLEQICDSASAGAVEIYGHITLIDDLGNQFSLFSRKRSDQLFINLHNSSLILGREKLGGPRCLPSVFWLDFQLKLKGDTEEHVVEFNEYMFIDCTSDVIYDQLQQSSVGTPDVQVHVHYIIFRCALLARPGFVVEKSQKTDDDDDSDIVHVDLSGSIDALYQMSDLSWRIQRLFDETQKLKVGDFTEGPTLAAPAYSTLFFALDLHVNGEYFRCAHDTLKFDTHDTGGLAFEKQIRGRNYLIRLILSWRIAIRELPENQIREWCDVDRVSRFTKMMKNSYNKRPRSRRQSKILLNDQLIYIQPHLQSLNNRNWIITDGAEELVEIFSISICSYNVQSGSLSLKGSIFGYDSSKELDLFKGGILHSDDDIVKLVAFDSCFLGWYFGIHIKLEDDDGREICNGYAAYSEGNVRGWFNRRICSVIRDKYGYAALHYTIFQDAVEAKLKFTLESNFGPNCAGYQVCGRISTMYNNLRYSTHYDKKYYQSRLFEKHDSEPVMLEGDEIPLSKSAVAVPLNASLIVVGNIDVMMKERHLGSFQFEEIFPSVKPYLVSMIEKSNPKKIYGSNFSLSVHVEWGYSS